MSLNIIIYVKKTLIFKWLNLCNIFN
jgi:hypothetical protein